MHLLWLSFFLTLRSKRRFADWDSISASGLHLTRTRITGRNFSQRYLRILGLVVKSGTGSARKLALQDTSQHRMTSGRYRCPQNLENMITLGLKVFGVRDWVSTFLLCCPIIKVFEAQKGTDICNGFLWLRTSQTRMPRSMALGQISGEKLREAKKYEHRANA